MTKDLLFNRRVKVTVISTTSPAFEDAYDVKAEPGANTLVIEDLRVEFEIEHTLSKHPSSCNIKIYNLNEATRSAFKKTPLRVTLEAGYVDDTAMIFTGDVTYVMSTLNGPDWVTSVELGDGDRVLTNARVNKSYAAGVTGKSVLEDILKSVGQQLPDNIRNHPALNKAIQGGLALAGPHKDVIDKLLKPHGLSMTIQDNRPIIISKGTVVGQTYRVDESSGLIGSPEFGKPDKKKKAPDVTIRTLLYPEIRPGHPVNVATRDLNGLFKVKKVKHRGDTHGQDWMTEIEVTPTGSTGGCSSPAGFGGGRSSGAGAGSSF